jgi:uncharacterized membrane protein
MNNTLRFSVTLLVMVYVAGIVGMLSSLRDLFIAMTPFSLLLSYALLCWNAPMKNTALLTFLFWAFGLGFFSEVLGVNTGFPFGDYTYGSVLGPKLWATPLLIGINWTLVTFTANELVRQYLPPNKPVWLFLLLGATLPTLLDALIEPVAIQLGYWTWATGGLPEWPNYAGWFAVSLLISFGYRQWIRGPLNPIAPWLWGLQLLFFAALGTVPK